MTRPKVGMLTLPAIEDIHRSFEYAGAGEIWNLDACCVPVTYDGHYWILGSRPGTCVESWFQNRIGGCYGSDNRNKEPRPGDFGIQMDPFTAAKHVLSGALVLEPDWKCCVVGEYQSGDPIYRVASLAEIEKWEKKPLRIL